MVRYVVIEKHTAAFFRVDGRCTVFLWDVSRLRLWRWKPCNTGRHLSALHVSQLRSWQYEYYICHFALEMPAKSWILVWQLVFIPCQCSYIAQDIVCCSWQMVRESWSPDCRWREGSSLGTQVWIRNYPCIWRIRHWCSLETLCWILLWGQASWDSLTTLIVYFEVSHSVKDSMTFVTSTVEPDLLLSWLLHWLK